MLKLIPILTFTSLLISCIGQNNGSSTLAKNEIPKNEPGIVGGQVVPEGSNFSKMVVLIRGLQEKTETIDGETYLNRTFDVCTGAFISENVILTAAHCIFDEPYKLEVVYSQDLRDFEAPTSQIEKVVKHPDYDGSTSIDDKHMSDDIALIKIKGKKPADYKILGLTKIPASSRNFSMTAIGYGRTAGVPATEEDPLQGLGVLRSTSVNVVGFDTKKNYFYTNQRNGRGVCAGDSGGPGIVKLNQQHYLIGVATAAVHRPEDVPTDGSALDVCKVSAAYGNVQYYAEWITQTLKLFQSKSVE